MTASRAVPRALAVVVAVGLAGCGDDRGSRGRPAATATAPARTTASPSPNGTTMDIDAFWTIIADADGTPGRLHAALAELPQDDLVAFERLHESLMDRAYTWDLWGAGYLRFDGMGDDDFDYFRAYLVSRGRSVFEAAVGDPDTLADVELDDGEEWEDWMSPTMQVVHARTGAYDAADPEPRRPAPSEPSGEEWDETDLPGRFPRIARAFG